MNIIDEKQLRSSIREKACSLIFFSRLSSPLTGFESILKDIEENIDLLKNDIEKYRQSQPKK